MILGILALLDIVHCVSLITANELSINLINRKGLIGPNALSMNGRESNGLTMKGAIGGYL
jgi:hypothetical protein